MTGAEGRGEPAILDMGGRSPGAVAVPQVAWWQSRCVQVCRLEIYFGCRLEIYFGSCIASTDGLSVGCDRKVSRMRGSWVSG